MDNWTSGHMDNNLTPISSLQERYGLSSRQAVYDRINDLKIVPAARGKLSSEQLDILDKLDTFLTNNPGAAIADFPKEAEISPVERMEKPFTAQLDKSDLSSGQLDKLQPADNFIELVREIAAAVQPKVPQRNPLDYFADLENAAANSWLLTSAEVKALIGVKPVVKKGDRSFTRGSFSFVKSGKIGSSTAWKVLKKV